MFARPSFYIFSVVLYGIASHATSVQAESPHVDAPPLHLDAQFVTTAPNPVVFDKQPTGYPLSPSRSDQPEVTDEERDRVHRGRIMLATGIPAAIAGPLAITWSRPRKEDNCYLSTDNLRPTRLTGVTLTAVGFGVTLGGIVALVRSTRAAREERKSRRSRIRIAFAATGATLLSSLLLVGVGTGNMVTCYSS